MNTIDLYSVKSSLNVLEVFKEFDRLKAGGILPSDGACGLFYDFASFPGETILLKHKKRFVFFHIEHDDVIQEMDPDNVRWSIDLHEGKGTLSILFPHDGGLNRIDITLDAGHGESRLIMKNLTSSGKIEIAFLNLLYGGIVKEKTALLKIPKDILKKFP